MIVTTRRKWRLTPRMRANTPAPTSRRHEAGAECAPNHTAKPRMRALAQHNGKPRMRALARPQREAQNAGTGTHKARSPECGHEDAQMRAHHRGCTAAESSENGPPLLFHHLRRALRDGTTSQSLRIGVKKNSTVLLEEPLKTPENLQKQLLDTNFTVCSCRVVLVPAAPNTFQIARKRIAALFLPLAMLHKTKCRQLNGLQRTACSALIFSMYC